MKVTINNIETQVYDKGSYKTVAVNNLQEKQLHQLYNGLLNNFSTVDLSNVNASLFGTTFQGYIIVK